MRRITTAAALILCIVLTACSAGALPSGPSTTLNVDMSEFMFTPTNYSIPAGKTITLQLKNSGDIKTTVDAALHISTLR